MKNRDNTANRFLSTDVAASLSIIIARIFYAVNWFNVAAIFPLIALDFENDDIALLGSISAAFFIGVGIFQIPAGIFAAKFTPRSSAIFGIALSSIAALLYGFSSEASQLIWLRFIVGAGMAFFFSSGIVLIARYASAKFSGFSIGLMNSAHSVGGIIGIFAWIVIAQIVGWRPSLILSGAIGIVTAILMFVAVPTSHEAGRRLKGSSSITHDEGALDDERREEKEEKSSPSANKQAQEGTSRGLDTSDIWRILSNTLLIALGLVLIGVQASWALLLTFIVVYLQSLNISLEGAGVIASMALISAIISAPLIGGFYDRAVKNARKILVICGAGISISFAAMSSQIMPVIIISVISIGFFSGGAFTLAYAIARRMRIIISSTTGSDVHEQKDRNDDNSPELEPRRGEEEKHDKSKDKMPDYSALNIAWINGLSLLGILWMPLVFSFTVKSWAGYPGAWLLSAILVALFVFIPLQKVAK